MKASFAILILYLAFTQAAYKKWRKNTNFDNPINWENSHMPCSKDQVVFPDASSPIFIQTNMSVLELVLPSDGEIILGNFMSIAAPNDRDSSEEEGCSGIEVRFTRTAPLDWFDQDNWCEVSGPDGDCMASPKERLDTELVPCQQDTVIFPPDSTFLVSLGNSVDIFMGTLRIGKKQYTTGSFKSFLNSQEGSRQFKRTPGGTPTTINIQGSSCTDVKGCTCGTDTDQIKKKICGFQGPRCPEVTCRTPLQPNGHCCAICGATLELTTGLAFRINNINDLVADKKTSYQSQYQMHTIVSRKGSELIQVVVHDDGDGSDGVTLATQIKQALEQDAQGDNKYRVTKVTMEGEAGGTQPDKHTGHDKGSGGMNRGSIAGLVLALILGLAVAAVAMYCLIDRNRCRRPRLEIPESIRRFGRRRQPSQLELTPSIPFKESVYFTDVTRGFDNPMYDTPGGAKDQGGIVTFGAGPAVIDSSDVTFKKPPESDDGQKGGFSNPLYDPKPQCDGEAGARGISDGLPDSPMAQVVGDTSPGDLSNPTFDQGVRAFTNPMYGTENLGPSSLHLNPIFSDKDIETDSTV